MSGSGRPELGRASCLLLTADLASNLPASGGFLAALLELSIASVWTWIPAGKRWLQRAAQPLAAHDELHQASQLEEPQQRVMHGLSWLTVLRLRHVLAIGLVLFAGWPFTASPTFPPCTCRNAAVECCCAWMKPSIFHHCRPWCATELELHLRF